MAFKRTKKILGLMGLQFGQMLGYRMVKGNWNYTTDLARAVFDFRKKEQYPQETFQEATIRLGLTEEDLFIREHDFERQAILFTLAAVGVFGYAIYMLSQQAWYAMVISLLIMLIFVVRIIRARFWVYQIRQQKLGCTFKEWWYASSKEKV